jgi:predicted signal transduction protein with EAL and GGDEF domain
MTTTRSEGGEAHPSAASWLGVALAWLVVGIPLLWGILTTFRKALPLFR